MKIDLRRPNLREVPIGVIVISSKGYEWELINRDEKHETWKDLTTGIIWFDKTTGKFTFDDALEKFGHTIPTGEEWRIFQNHGGAEILPNMDASYWSSTACPHTPNFYYRYGKGPGLVSCIKFYLGSVRCISRPAQEVL